MILKVVLLIILALSIGTGMFVAYKNHYGDYLDTALLGGVLGLVFGIILCSVVVIIFKFV